MREGLFRIRGIRSLKRRSGRGNPGFVDCWSDGTQNYLIGVDAPARASGEMLARVSTPIRNVAGQSPPNDWEG
ncbi:MAG TPA: hypothetical protein VGL41_10420 [Roseiarcus sp.]